MVLSVYTIYLLVYTIYLTVHAQSDLETTKHRDMIIDLGNGLKTNARLNLPANGNGPFPGVLLASQVAAKMSLMPQLTRSARTTLPVSRGMFQISQILIDFMPK